MRHVVSDARETRGAAVDGGARSAGGAAAAAVAPHLVHDSDASRSACLFAKARDVEAADDWKTALEFLTESDE